MYYVLTGEFGECYGEYETFEEAERVCDELNESGEDAWLSSDEEFEYDDSFDECGFDPYEGCYTYDC